MAWVLTLIGDDYMFDVFTRTVDRLTIQDLILMANQGNYIYVELPGADYEAREFRIREIRDEFDRIPTNAILGYEWALYYENMQGTFYAETLEYNEIGEYLARYLEQGATVEFVYITPDGKHITVDSIVY